MANQPTFELLPPRNPGFLGQENLLNDIHHRFSDPPLEDRSILTVVPLVGPSGIGKTQIALEYAYRHRESYTAVFWVPASATSLVEARFLEIATLVQLPRPFEQIPVLLAAVHTWLQEHSGWLLIFDGAVPAASKYLPRAGAGDIIVTSLNDWH